MADPKPGQFGSKENDASKAGEMGSKAQSTAAKAKGGRNSRRGNQSDNNNDST